MSNELTKTETEAVENVGIRSHSRPTTTAKLPVWTPRTDVYQTEQAMVIVMDLPGVPSEQLEVEVENNSLRITGEATAPLNEKMQWLRREVRSRRYHRTFQLGDRVNTKKLNARLKDGVLTITIPFKTETMARKIEISG